MTRSDRQRLSRLETVAGIDPGHLFIVGLGAAALPLGPDGNVDRAMINQWLEDGRAKISGGVIVAGRRN